MWEDEGACAGRVGRGSETWYPQNRGKWFSLGLTNLLSISWIALTRGAGILVLLRNRLLRGFPRNNWRKNREEDQPKEARAARSKVFGVWVGLLGKNLRIILPF